MEDFDEERAIEALEEEAAIEASEIADEEKAIEASVSLAEDQAIELDAEERDIESWTESDVENVLHDFCRNFNAPAPRPGPSEEQVYKALRALGYGLRVNDPSHDQQASCANRACKHPYERHFDPYEGDREVGCKYCPCRAFVEPTSRAD